jgi:predicted aldo/keto reductase-like oxidoreductase
MRQAFKWGVTYWETSENKDRQKGIGEYLAKYPEDRKKMFLVSRLNGNYMFRQDWTVNVEESLERMNTSYIDLYLVDRMDRIGLWYIQRKNKVVWSEKMKNEGKIRFFGISTHAMVAECLSKAVTLGGIDGIQFAYNFRNMHTDSMKSAIEACVNAGIGLTAMKTRGDSSYGIPFSGLYNAETPSELLSKAAGQFLKKGFNDNQARLMAVWQNSHIASISSLMPNMKILKENVDAALNYMRFSSRDMSLLKKYADLTAPGYCTGCANICEPAVKGSIPISDIMRYRMYYHGYGDCDRARALFREIPVGIRRKITRTDFTIAEKRCPQKMPIGLLMKETAVELS